MKKLFLSTLLLALPLLASAYDIAVKNADDVTIFYNYYNNGTELEVAGAQEVAVVNIPEEVTYMGRTRKVTSIGQEAFRQCWITSVTIGNSVTSIGDLAFSLCTDLTSVTIGNSVTSIGNSAFSGCSGLTSVTIPNSVTSIGEHAFSDCTSLTSVTIPNSVTSIGWRAFNNCRDLKKVIVKDVAAWCAISFEDNPLLYAHHIYRDENTEITDLVIPNSVTSIGRRAFNECSGLTSVTIGNSVTSIGDQAFSLCTGLTSMTIGNSVTSIGDQAFSGCRSLTSITIPNSVTSIGHSAFEGCSGLSSATIPNSVASIGNRAFSGCSSLTSVTIPNSVTSIGNSAFSGCSGLTSVTIPNSVTTIGNSAFYSCSGLTSVISKMENPCYIDPYCFHNDVFHNTTLYVPKGTTDKYKATNYWSKFVFIEEGEPGSSTQPEEKKCATPKISYANKKLTFSCETEGVEFISEIMDIDVKKFYDSNIDLSATYEISVYATKSGYTNSDVATATLVWTDAVFTETTPSTSSAKAIAESIPMLISAQNGTITVRGEQNGHPLTVYTADGKMLGSATMKDGQASISTNLQRGGIAIVKVGSKSVKIKM